MPLMILALTHRVFLVDRLQLGFAHPLEDNLLRGLRRDPPEILHRHEVADLVPQLRTGINPQRILQRNFGLWVGDRLHDLLERDDFDLSGLRVEVDLDVVPAPYSLRAAVCTASSTAWMIFSPLMPFSRSICPITVSNSRFIARFSLN
jgi:hypothetical protein